MNFFEKKIFKNIKGDICTIILVGGIWWLYKEGYNYSCIDRYELEIKNNIAYIVRPKKGYNDKRRNT
jgi:hypothetical protein